MRALPVALLLALASTLSSGTGVQGQTRAPSTAPPAPAPAVDPALFDGMTWRMVGPFRGGRVTAVTGIAEQPHTFFFGSTGGGVWKTDDAGHHWTPIADEALTTGAVGAIDVADSDPRVIYVGTGSTSIRGNISIGRGVWRTRDGGESWSFAGLPHSGAIGSLIVHPDDPDRVWVAALGNPFGRNEERGVYRTRDGGETWEHALFLNDSTGAVSLAMDPRDPQVLYAGMWRAERKPWTLISGGMEGGLYKTTDGGDSWTKLAGGLPEGLVGKVKVSLSRANPDRVWAMVEAEPGNGLYRSDDGGESWSFVTNDSRLTNRAFYYHHVIADPNDADVVYVLNVGFYRSDDGGESFERIPVHHGDVHDLWINPDDSDLFVVGDDGGAEVSLNGGRTLSGVYNQPTAELYDVQVDNGYPYRLYGSQQDNSTISVPAFRSNNNLRPQEGWSYAAGCEVGPVALDPDDPSVIWSGCYGGVINRWDRTTDVRRNMNLHPENQSRAPSELEHRFQWVAPIVVDPLDPQTVYHASQYLNRTRDGGHSWETISPDLTTDTPEHQRLPGGPIHSDHTGVEVFNTIFAVAPSLHTRGTIWVGTDDGRVHLTRDDGANWSEITPPEMPRHGTVNRIELSPHDPARAYLAVHRYREADFRPWIFRTDDYGATWTSLADGSNGIPDDHWVRVVREDDVRPGLLYAGTEFGLFVSFDDGARWQRLRLNLPATPIMDAKVAHGDLAVATQGRSFWVLDDLTPLRELAAGLESGTIPSGDEPDVVLFTPRDAARGRAFPPLQEMDINLPDPLPAGALLHYTVVGALDSLLVEVLDGAGRVVSSWPSAPTAPGLHRIVWGLRDSDRGGAKMPPGEYAVRVTSPAIEGVRERRFRVVPDPLNTAITQADYDAQYRVTVEVAATLGEVQALQARLDSLDAAERDAVMVRAEQAGVEAERLALLRSDLSTLLSYFNSGGGYGAGAAEGAPTASGLRRKAALEAEWASVREGVEAALRGGGA
ncbi:VPS10 domain-containing protein [Gaopeijia maritima]|uniref:Sortilin N-terminal domain-containing protein n=1 Tax=Gaopeijia maritima TaxID=3119007 RepID=A0ABU9E7I8_9BACT